MVRAALRLLTNAPQMGVQDRLNNVLQPIVSHGRYLTFQIAAVVVPRQMFAHILTLVASAAGVIGLDMKALRDQNADRKTRKVCPDEE
jgi:hypothetical protein